MGTWGTGISSNDTYADIYQNFFDLYNEGFSVSDITKRLIMENQEIINLPEDSNNFWFAIAKAQWECKELDVKVFDKIEKIIKNDEDIIIWKELEASPIDLKARKKVLMNFLDKLKTEKVKPKKRVEKKFYDSVFKKEDCLIYLMENGNYGGAFVLTDSQATETGTNHIAITTIDKKEKPTIEDFKNAEVYVKRFNQVSFVGTEMQQNWIDQPQIGTFSTLLFKRNEFDIEVIGQLKIYKECKNPPYIGMSWSALISTLPSKEKYQKLNGKPTSKIKLSNWTKKHWL